MSFLLSSGFFPSLSRFFSSAYKVTFVHFDGQNFRFIISWPNIVSETWGKVRSKVEGWWKFKKSNLRGIMWPIQIELRDLILLTGWRVWCLGIDVEGADFHLILKLAETGAIGLLDEMFMNVIIIVGRDVVRAWGVRRHALCLYLFLSSRVKGILRFFD